MAILFAVVARGPTILAKHAWCGGNFLEVTEQNLAKIPPENNKLTYSHGNYLLHYICQDRIVYLFIMDDDFERSQDLNFLNEIKKRAQTALPYVTESEFSSVLAAQLKKSHGFFSHYHHYHRINCVHLYHCLTSLWWIYMAKLCEEIRKKKLTLTKDMREQGVKSNPCDSNLSHTDRWYLLVSSTLFSLFKILFYASRFIFVLLTSLFPQTSD
uniref:Longin domain-containing protein n=1 Tax=Saimiri boliviensis boliviensis TaxID=39432 RepID=A0A2K6SRX6_SAIBB